MFNTEKIKVVIFDLDGTLYKVGWLMKFRFFCKLFPRSRWLPAYMKLRKALIGLECKNSVALKQALAVALAKKVKADPTRVYGWFEEAFYPAFVSTLEKTGWRRPGLDRVLEHLKTTNKVIAVVSDFAYVDERLAALNIEPSQFDYCLSCEECGTMKPSPRAFGSLVSDIGVGGEDVLIVGDRDDTDGDAARKMGAQFLFIREEPKPHSPGMTWEDARHVLLDL